MLHSIISGKMKLIGLRPAPESTMAATMPTTAISMTAGMSSLMNGCLSFGSVGGACVCMLKIPRLPAGPQLIPIQPPGCGF